MHPSKTILLTLVICCQWWSADATFLNLLQYGNGTNATYGLNFRPVGPIGIIGSVGAGIAALGAIALFGRGIFGRRFGRSLEEPQMNVELVLSVVESLDNDGCAKRFLCEEAALRFQERNDRIASPVLQGFASATSDFADNDFVFDEEKQNEDDDNILNEFGEIILDFVRDKDDQDIDPGSSRYKWLSLMKFGEDGGDCTSSPCPLNRTEILRDLRERGILQGS